MKCPFPGMDPYIERPEIWPDFHDSLIAYIREALQPLLRPKYVALTQDRLYVVESERPIRPDVAILRSSSRYQTQSGGAAVLELDAPVVFDLYREEMREPLVTIIEPSAGNRVVTAIEVLSPDNKKPGTGREAYLQKREEFWEGGTNLVEIDLLRFGQSTVRLSPERLSSLPPWRYLAGVSRITPSRQEVYAVALAQRLPRIGIPLAAKEPVVPLDLQLAFSKCWEGGPYPELLLYEGPPPGRLSPDEATWCASMLKQAGFRETLPANPSS